MWVMEERPACSTAEAGGRQGARLRHPFELELELEGPAQSERFPGK